MASLLARLSVLAIVSIIPGGQIALADSPIRSSWSSKIGLNNSLVGKIFTGSGKPVNAETLIKQARLTRFVLLGEIHDNPDHHQIQASIIEAIAEENHRPAVVLEMVPQRLGGELANVDLASDPRLDDLARRLEWEKRGWYSWNIYRPVAWAAARNNLPMVAGNIDREMSRSIAQIGLGALSENQRNDFGLTDALPVAMASELREELQTSHCNLLPAKSLPAMIMVQRARDGLMADAMIRAGYRFGSILIAGNGHIRKDRAVPRILLHRLPGNKTVTIGHLNDAAGGSTRELKVRLPHSHNLAIALVEVEEELESWRDYPVVNQAGQPLYDFVIFTPKFDDTDHCAAMREHLKIKKQPNP